MSGSLTFSIRGAFVLWGALCLIGAANPVLAVSEGSVPELSTLQNKELKKELRKIVIRDHRTTLSYTQARREIVGQLHMQSDRNGNFIHEVYCQKDYYMRGSDGGTLNVEHTWPQSRFSGSQKATQKSDLHHLYPADKDMNNRRANFKFGDVDGRSENLKCSESRLGLGRPDGPRFEPPDEHKGNVARALFYFSVRYSIPIDSDEEETLKSWNHLDPVDAEELERNDKIEKIQGNRNPFIDHPEYADRIADF